MDDLKIMQKDLINLVRNQFNGNLANVDTKELGEAIDMIKDLAETMYYCSVVEAMEKESKNHKEEMRYYGKRMIPYEEEWERDMDREKGRMYYPKREDYPYRYPMYYDGNSSSGSSNNGGQSSGGNNAMGGGSRGYTENTWTTYPMKIEDKREGKSPNARKMYMESKEMHKGKDVQMQELEKYIHELGSDITEMVHDASIEEKQMLKNKINELMNKIG